MMVSKIYYFFLESQKKGPAVVYSLFVDAPIVCGGLVFCVFVLFCSTLCLF